MFCFSTPVIPSEVEESRCESFTVMPRDPSTSLRMTVFLVK